jgi:hypothetical protein
MTVVFTVQIVKPRKKKQAFPGLSGIGITPTFTTTVGVGADIKKCFKKSSVQEGEF